MERPRPSSLDEALERAARLADEGRWDEAVRLLAEQEQAHPHDATLLAMLGVAARELGAEGLAYDLFRRAWAEHPEDPTVLLAIGAGLAALDDPDAEAALRAAALLAPQDAQPHLVYGSYLRREGQLESALDQLERAHALEPESSLVLTELGCALWAAGRMSEAAEAWAAAAALDPAEPRPLVLYGLLRWEQGEYEEAAASFLAAAARAPEDGELQLLAALAAAAQGWGEPAEQAWERAERLAPVTVDAAWLLETEDLLADATAARQWLDETAVPAVRHRYLEPAFW